MSKILRYDGLEVVISPLNPIEDVVSWICGLSSTGYVSDILRTVHGISRAKEINKCTQLISTYAETSVGLIEQAYSGPAEVSFLPLYYALLNLSKIYIILSGKRVDLEKNQWHGASYKPVGKSRRELLTEEITLKDGGVLPLFYETLSGLQWREGGKKIKLCDIYPYIWGISHEYSHAYKKPYACQQILIELVGSSSNGYKLLARLGTSEHPKAGRKKCLKILEKFHADRPQSTDTFVSDKVYTATEEIARHLLLKNVKRNLLYELEFDLEGEVAYCWTPLSGRKLLLPEEIPIWIAFFHLSNIVRYNPEFVSKVKDSRSWPMLRALRKHTVLRFLLLFWSYLHQKTFILRPP